MLTDNGQITGIIKDRSVSRAIRSAVMGSRMDECRPVGTAEANRLLQDVSMAREAWESACTCFEYAHDEEMIDYYIYTMKACQARYEFLLRKAKELCLKAGAAGSDPTL